MSTAQITSSRRLIWAGAIVFSLVILAIGLWVSLATGEWIALLCAGGLVVFPASAVAFLRSRKSSR